MREKNSHKISETFEHPENTRSYGTGDREREREKQGRTQLQ